jgi:hypothetical protein
MAEQNIPHWQNTFLDDIAGELWKDIRGLEGTHQVSNMGRVKSLSRIANDGKRRLKTLIMKQCRKGEGSITVGFARISHLVCDAFVEEKKLHHTHVRHKDNNNSNNVPENLCWETEDFRAVVQKEIKRKKIYISKFFGVGKGSWEGKKIWRMRIKNLQLGLKIEENFYTELEAAKKHDFYIKKFKLDRELNFPDNK